MKRSTAAIIGLGFLGGVAVALELRSARTTFAGKHALITGGSRGLGLALARELSLRGARVSLVARSESDLAAAVDDLRKRGGDAASFVADLAQDDDGPIAELIDRIELERGPIDLLVNNAGRIVVGPVQAMTVNNLKETMAMNFLAAVRLTLTIAPRMAKRGGGHVVNISSVGGKVPVPHLAAYSASKFALNGFFGAARGDWRRDGIRITTVNPGLMRTGSTGNALVQGDHAKEYAWFTLGDSMPGLSMSAARAARKIIDAASIGRAEITLGLPARVGARAYGIAPSFTLDLTRLATFFLPRGTDSQTRKGSEVESGVTRSKLTWLTQRAREDLNQRR